jgi:serine phosphatase RsbU (regulator of sigma subunit)
MNEHTVLGNFQINLPAPNGASVSISSYVIEGETPEGLNERMDVYREALLRQQAILEIPVLEKAIEAQVKMLEDHRKAYADLLERSKAKYKLTSQEQAQMTNLPVQIKQIEKYLDEGKAKIASVKKAA